MDRTHTYKKLDVVAVDQHHYSVRGGNREGERWRVGIILSVDRSASQPLYRGSYLGTDGKPNGDGFEVSSDAAFQRIEFARVEHTVAVPEKWQKQLIDSPPAEPRQPTPGLDDEPPGQHPSYGVATVSRCSGSAKLFMSPFRHQHFMSMSIHRAERHRNLSDSTTFARGELVEVHFSESQWARLLSSVGSGGGTPCTINHVGGVMMPECPENDEKTKFQEEVEKAAKEAAADLTAAISKFETLMDKPTVTKAERKEVMNELQKAHRALAGSLPFVISQFTERMEIITDEAKTEIQAFVDNTFRNAGLEKLLGEGGAGLTLLGGKKE